MIFNIISISISLIIFERFYNGCMISKSNTLILKEIQAPHFFLMSSLEREINDSWGYQWAGRECW